MLAVRRREDDGIDLRIGEDLVETVAKRDALPGAERLGLGARPGMPGGEAEGAALPLHGADQGLSPSPDSNNRRPHHAVSLRNAGRFLQCRRSPEGGKPRSGPPRLSPVHDIGPVAAVESGLPPAICEAGQEGQRENQRQKERAAERTNRRFADDRSAVAVAHTQPRTVVDRLYRTCPRRGGQSPPSAVGAAALSV